MGCRQKLLLSFMVGGFVLFYGTTVIAALTSQEIAKTTLGSTVLLRVKDVKGNSWTGSGFVIRDGQIATNHHIIDNMEIGGARLVGKEEVYPIKAIRAVDKARDLAIVKVTGLDVPALPLGDSDAVQIGDKVYVAGNPRELEGTFTGGMISAIRPEGIPLVRGKTLQMDASISPGSSGGPVLNDSGEVIGISVGYRIDGQNLNFAIPVNYLKRLANIPITPTPIKSKPVKPKVAPPFVKPKPVKPKVTPPPAEPKQVKPQGDPPPVEPKLALTPQEIAEIALGSTVHLATIIRKGGSTGSGFFVAPNQIATNYHVIEAILNEGALGGAKLVGKEEIYAIEDIVDFDKENDLAIVKVREVKGTGIDVPALPLGDSDTVQIGETIYVAGNPQGLEGTFSDGIISAIRGDSTDKVFQMTAPISQGSSGGPVLNEKGEVIGVSFATFRDGQNLNFAIPVNYLKPMVIMPSLPTPVKPKVDPPPVKPKQVKPKVDSSPVEPEPVKPKVDPPVEPKQIKPQVDSPKPEPSKLRTRHDALEKGIKLYEQARYNEAIEALSSAVREIEDPEQQAEAYLYLGGSKRGSGESNDKVKEQFQEAIRHNPDQKLPTRIGKDHPIFAELLEEVRKALTGKLTVISLLPHTEIWIDGNGIDKKMLGTGIVSRRLLEGDYIVEGIYAGGFKRRAVTIESNHHQELDLEIPPIVKHDSPPRISVGEIIPLTLNLISSKAPQQVTIYYKTYDKDGNELEQNNQEMRLWDTQPALSTWIYKVGLPSQKHVGSIEYYIEVVYENRLTFKQPATQYRHYQISIFDDKPPTIDLLNPPESAQFAVNQQTTVRAEVIDNSVVEEVRIYFLATNGQSRKLFKEGSSDMYTINITLSRAGSIEYYLTATDEAGNESQSESRHIDIRLEADPQEPEEESPEIVELPDKRVPPIEPDTPDEPDAPEKPRKERTPPVEPPPPRQTYPIYQGIWVSVAANDTSTPDWDGGNTFRLAYLREGKTHSTLGARLDFSHPDRTNISAIVQWGPALEKSDIAFTLLAGIAQYKDVLTRDTLAESIYTTPILGVGLKFYPRDKIAIDATSSIKFRSAFDTTNLYHYEIGARFYISHKLNLRVGYGKLYLGNRNVTTMQIGLGYTF